MTDAQEDMQRRGKPRDMLINDIHGYRTDLILV